MAEDSRLRAGNVIIAAGECSVTNLAKFARGLQTREVGDRTLVGYIQDGKTHRGEIVLKPRPTLRT